MINHVRTLLMNLSRSGTRLTDPGEEYIPTDFVPRALTQTLQLLRTTLFGNRPDRFFVNYRMRQLMQLLHATQLAVDVLATDSRVTYLPFKPELFDTAFQTVVTVVGDSTIKPSIAGEHTANMSLGLARQLWALEVLENGVVAVTKRLGNVETQQFPSDKPIQLPGSNLQVFLYSAPVGYKVLIEATARPVMDVGSLLTAAVATLGAHGADEIFPLLAPEPVATWRRIWVEHPTSVMRFAAMLLAMAYRTEQLPQELRNG